MRTIRKDACAMSVCVATLCGMRAKKSRSDYVVVTVRIPRTAHAALRKIADRDERTLCYLLRKAAMAYLELHGVSA